MAIKPKDLKISVTNVVESVEVLLDKRILKTRTSTGAVSLNVIGDFQILRHQDLRDRVIADLSKLYRSAGWGVVRFTMEYKSDPREGSWVSFGYVLKEVNEEIQ